MIRRALAALVIGMLVFVGASAVASAEVPDTDTTCKTYTTTECHPTYPPKPPPPTPHPTPPKALAKTGADNQIPLLAIGGALVVVGAAAYGTSRLRRQN
jgi:LPXTG-motif cell wall-anchored protein